MDRTSGAGNVNRLFVGENVAAMRPPTEITAEWLNGIQEELINTIVASGLIPDAIDNGQLLQAIQLHISTALIPQSAQHAPVGTIFDFAGHPASVPAEMLVLPVSPTNVSRTSYAALFAVIGTAWGAGDGATTFGLPWLPSAHATLQGYPNPGTLGIHTLGEVMAHSHTTTLALGTIGGAANQCVTSALFQQNYNFPSDVVGGPANLAAGVFVTKMIKYI